MPALIPAQKLNQKEGSLPDLSAFADLRRISVGKEAKCETGPVTLLLFLLQKSPGAGYGKDAATRFEYKEDWAHYFKMRQIIGSNAQIIGSRAG